MLPYEHELGEPVAAWLAARGFKVYAEVSRPTADQKMHFRTRSGSWRVKKWAWPWANVDLVGVRWSRAGAKRVVAVELKRRVDRVGLRQAKENRRCAHESWLAAWAASPAMIAEAAREGIGVLVVSRAGEVREVHGAEWRRCYGAAELARRAKRTPKDRKPGRTAKPIVPGFKPGRGDEGVVMVRLRRAEAERRRKRVYGNLEELAASVPHHYASYASVKSSMRRLALSRQLRGIPCQDIWYLPCKCSQCKAAEARLAALGGGRNGC